MQFDHDVQFRADRSGQCRPRLSDRKDWAAMKVDVRIGQFCATGRTFEPSWSQSRFLQGLHPQWSNHNELLGWKQWETAQWSLQRQCLRWSFRRRIVEFELSTRFSEARRDEISSLAKRRLKAAQEQRQQDQLQQNFSSCLSIKCLWAETLSTFSYLPR